MGPEPFALSVHHFISSVGADAGFAAIIGLAVLVLLYFAQARETASLREHAEVSEQRVAQLESRLSRVSAQPQTPPAAAGSAPGLASVIPGLPNPPPPPIAAMPNPAAPAGVAAPPLSAATKLIPTPAVYPAAVPHPSVAAARIGAPATPSPFPATAAGVVPALPGPAQVHAPPGSPPPMNKIVTPRPATAAGGATGSNGTNDHPLIAPAPPPGPARAPVQIRPGGGSSRPALLGGLGDGIGSGSPNGLSRVLVGLAAVAVLAAIVVVLVSVTGGASTPKRSHVTTPTTNAPATQHHRSVKKPAVNDASVAVAVLNGTAMAGLAKGIATQLGTVGFQQGAVTNAATQTQATTTVEYLPGDQKDAAAVARALKLPASSVQPITPDTQALAGTAQVVVTLGQDEATAQTQTTTTP